MNYNKLRALFFTHFLLRSIITYQREYNKCNMASGSFWAFYLRCAIKTWSVEYTNNLLLHKLSEIIYIYISTLIL